MRQLFPSSLSFIVAVLAFRIQLRPRVSLHTCFDRSDAGFPRVPTHPDSARSDELVSTKADIKRPRLLMAVSRSAFVPPAEANSAESSTR